METETSRTERGENTWADASAAELREAFRQGATDPVEVLDAVWDRVEACEPVINALWHTDREGARARAEESAARWRAGRPLSALDGVPVTIKENIAWAGVPMPGGHNAGEPVVPTENAPITDRLSEAGAVLFGVTVMPDWGMLSSGVSSRHGITRSPLDPTLTTGGSSSGAGAAAAAGYGPIHIGSDIGGSIRLPGTWLGLATLKPSFGRVPLSAPYLGRCAGPLARRVSDVREAMAVIGQPDVRDYSQLPAGEHGEAAGSQLGEHDPGDGSWDVRGLRVAVHTDAGCGSETDPEVAAAVDAAAGVLADAGARVERIDPFMDQQLLVDIDRFWRVRSWADFKALPYSQRREILPYVAQWCWAGADVPATDLMSCYHSIQEMRRRTIAATAEFDFVLSPVAPMAAFPAEWPMPFNDPMQPMQHISFAVPYNMAENPASSVPAGYTADGRTIGLQVAGRRFDDRGVLDLSAWFEQALQVSPAQRTVGR